MSSHKDYSLVVIGSGPGIGVHVASLFASKRFTKVALVARNPEQLAKDKAKVEQAVPGKVAVKTYSVDITDLPKLAITLAQIGSDLGTPECIFYNAAIIRPSKLLEYDEENILYEFKIATTSLHATARWAIPQLLELAKSDPASKPSFLITNSHLPSEPRPELFSLSLTKAAQMNLAQSMALTYKPQGVHVGMVIVAGVVDPSSPKLNPTYIADRAWELFDQPRETQTFTVEIRESK